MRRAVLAAGLAIAASGLVSGPARAADLVSGLSQDQIEITSNYTGTDLVVFGAVETRHHEVPATQPDVVVVLRGPDVSMTVRRKARIAGLWINRDKVVLHNMPGYYYLASSQPLDKIANAATLSRYELGLDNILPSNGDTPLSYKTKAYVQAAVREEARAQLYKQAPDGVEFLSNSLFRVRVPVPAGVPRGQYTAEVFLFQNGAVTSAQSTPLFVDQTGLERRLFTFAHTWPLAYGVSTVIMALMLGWLSSLVFRRR